MPRKCRAHLPASNHRPHINCAKLPLRTRGQAFLHEARITGARPLELLRHGVTGMKAELSTLWVFATFNYLYADVIALFDLRGAKKLSTGDAVAVHMSQ